MTQEKWNTYLHTWKSKIFTARNAKIAVTAIVICAVAGGGGAWYHHQQKQAYKEKKIQAMSQMIEAQAQAQNLTLIPEEKARALAAQAIRKDESSLSFSRISLIDLEGSKHEKGEDRHKEKDKKDKKDRDKKQDRDREKGRTPAPGTARPDDTAGATGKGTAPDTRPAPDVQPAATAPAAPATPAATAFHPVYQIRASDGDIHYHILIDAVSGDILASRIA